jgi:hypothetical protein
MRVDKIDQTVGTGAAVAGVQGDVTVNPPNPHKESKPKALTLNSLGTLYKSKNQSTEAAHFCNEAAAILKQLVAQNPGAYTPLLSQVCVH